MYLFIYYTYSWRFIFFIFLLNYLTFFLLIYRSSFICGISDIYILHISFTLHTDTLKKSSLKEINFDSEMWMEYSKLFSLWLMYWEVKATLSGLYMCLLLGGGFVRALLYSQLEQLVLGGGLFWCSHITIMAIYCFWISNEDLLRRKIFFKRSAECLLVYRRDEERGVCVLLSGMNPHFRTDSNPPIFPPLTEVSI